MDGFAFSGCTSLQSVNIPNTVTDIGKGAFGKCESLKSVHIPNSVRHIGWFAFDGCDKLQQRLTNGTNYHPDTITWLHQRFDNLPIHKACYDTNGYDANDKDIKSALDRLSTLIRDNHQALTAIDAMGMTPLHILCCKPFATLEILQVIIEGEPSLLNQTDVTDSTPLQLFLRCRNILGANEEFVMPTLPYLLKRGIKYDDLEILSSVLNMNQEIDFSISLPDESSGLMPFMLAATTKSGLDVVFALAMQDLTCLIEKN